MRGSGHWILTSRSSANRISNSGQMDLVIGFFARNPNDGDGSPPLSTLGQESARRIDARRYNTTGTISPKIPPASRGISLSVRISGVGDKGEGETKALENIGIKWCCEGGLNPRPLPYQGSALPLSYRSFELAALCHRRKRVASRLPHRQQFYTTRSGLRVFVFLVVGSQVQGRGADSRGRTASLRQPDGTAARKPFRIWS